MGLWDDIKDGAETAWNSGRLMVAVTEDTVDEHVLGRDGTNVYRLAQKLELPVTQEDVHELTRQYIADTPGATEAVELIDEGKQALLDLLPPGPWWAWALGGVFVLGLGVVVAAKLLR